MLCDPTNDSCVYYPDGTCYCPDAAEALMVGITDAAAKALALRTQHATVALGSSDQTQAGLVVNALTKSGAPAKIVILVSLDVAQKFQPNVVPGPPA